MNDEIWTVGKGPDCYCGSPTNTIEADGHWYLMCFAHTSGFGSMWPLPNRKPVGWPNITRAELDACMQEGQKEAEDREGSDE